VEVVLITRQGCHLCDDALGALRAVGVDPELRDVDVDEDLFGLYDWRVPVVLIDGRVVAEGQIDQEALRKALLLA
jgi:predicted thioredoxin/glutaredoxin